MERQPYPVFFCMFSREDYRTRQYLSDLQVLGSAVTLYNFSGPRATCEVVAARKCWRDSITFRAITLIGTAGMHSLEDVPLPTGELSGLWKQRYYHVLRYHRDTANRTH